ncbi:hypothetical protein T01_15196 [Trichinella spiralis]|uniref:Uncharacterized protein n=1 Tax=Trichinella spiralis TaxID=6334 RepID=A0A0V1BER3_TRISP|nr:hypothetical protein T01_15196 [Trichinella spiralis]
MKFKTVQFIFVWCCVFVQCFAFLSSSNRFLFCSLLWLMSLTYILYQIAAVLFWYRIKKAAVQIPVPFRTTEAGEDFLLWQCASRHILVFATGSNIRLLAAMRTWSMDGTFKFLAFSLFPLC